MLHLQPRQHGPGRSADDQRRDEQHQQITLNLPVDLVEDRRGGAPLLGSGTGEFQQALVEPRR
ncbi:hypothetical protein D3C83_81130 [compost metagenome]